MGGQATKIRDPIDGSRSHLRAMKAKVAAWVEETRHERSLVGPGAHRMAYSRMLGEPGDDGLAEGPPAEPQVERIEARAAPAEPGPLPARKRPRPDARPAPRLPRPASRQRQRAGGGGRSLFAISALAAVFVAAPVGYLVLERPGEAPPSTSRIVETRTPVKPAKIVDRVPMESEDEPALPKQAAGLLPAAQAAADRLEPIAAVARAMPKAEPETAPVEEATRTASLGQPRPEPAADQPRPAPDPRAQDLFEDGLKLMKLGEVAAARPFFERAAELGHVAALVELARTYDPVALKELNVVGLKPEPDKAIALYDKARAALGGRAAADGLLGLAARTAP